VLDEVSVSTASSPEWDEMTVFIWITILSIKIYVNVVLSLTCAVLINGKGRRKEMLVVKDIDLLYEY
jgi:hypothetical protein